MLWIGLTGGIGSGKSTVAELLRQRSCPVVDADQIVHKILTDKNSSGSEQVVKCFGPRILDANGVINRSILAKIVFADPDNLFLLESIIHPLVQGEVAMVRDHLEQSGQLFAFYDVPLLYEKNLESQFDLVALVYSNSSQQIERAMNRSSLSEEQVLLRMNHQIPLEIKKSKADYVIDNSGSIQDLNLKIDQLFKWIISSKISTKGSI